ncbi:MAG: hypothetical protein A2Y23_10185 [Clostridiales bacterium GWB2_37_7]|nr:MAG: hypothetical protein A2Y23_10185 [Clostridiales bacterium GWB2_37_7]
MKCKNHRDEEARFICDKCKMPICEQCSTELRGNKVCINCVDHAVYAERDRAKKIGFWNKFIFFIFACIPGAAHMQMGLFKRGMQLMLTFFGAIVLISYANVESFIPLAIIPTWFFSFFDAYNSRKKQLVGEVVEDIEAYNYEFIVSNKKTLGLVLVLFGFIGFLNAIDSTFSLFGYNVDRFYWAAKRAIIPLVFVISGLTLLAKLKKAEKEINESTEN